MLKVEEDIVGTKIVGTKQGLAKPRKIWNAGTAKVATISLENAQQDSAKRVEIEATMPGKSRVRITNDFKTKEPMSPIYIPLC